MKKLVVFDVDGVLADFEGRLVQELLREFGMGAFADRSKYSLEDRYSGDVLEYALRLTKDPNFYYGLDECEGSLRFFDTLCVTGFPVICVSGRPKSTENFTRRWIRKNTLFTGEVICGVKDKADFLSYIGESVEFVVEDNPEQIERLTQAGFLVYCWSQPWNEGILPRLYVRSDGELMLWETEDVESEMFWRDEVTQ